MGEIFDLEEVEELNRAHADRYASEFWDDGHLAIPEEDLEIFFRLAPGKRMLDVGCGWARYVDRFLAEGFKYHGIDLSPAMIAESKRRFPALTFQVMSFREIAFPDEFFDAIWCCCVLDHEPKQNMPNVLAEMRRVLVPGGILSSVEPSVYGSDEGFADSEDGPVFHAAWEPAEMEASFRSSHFTMVEKHIRPYDGAMAFHLRK